MIPINTQLPIAIGFVDSRQGGRAENQDTCGYADTPLGLLVVVCDGMGGGPSGKAASSTATDVIIQTVRSGKLSDSPLTVLQQAIKMANQALISEIQKKPALRGMGTTVTALLINIRPLPLMSETVGYTNFAGDIRSFAHLTIQWFSRWSGTVLLMRSRHVCRSSQT